MVSNKSLDVSRTIIAAMLRDAQASHGAVFSTRAMRLTTLKVDKRLGYEGIGFLTKTLPRLGKTFDQCLAGQGRFNSASHGFKTMINSELPKFLGEFFKTIFDDNGDVLRDPDATSVRIVRQLLISFGKLKLPYEASQEQEVIQAFCNAENDLRELSPIIEEIRNGSVDDHTSVVNKRMFGNYPREILDANGTRLIRISELVRNAQELLNQLFCHFDPCNIIPRHGPGAVATKQKHSGKYRWVNVSSRITDLYPYDEYFLSSIGHVCDTYREFNRVGTKDLPAKVILVPKDSRGPRLISCEPVDFQWIQGGLGKAIIRLVESHSLTKGKVNFTDQTVNRNKALSGSITGDDATLDLKEASDRVHTDLVRLLFPENVLPYLLACRSLSTILPNGQELKLNKYAPMGSALCFPVLSLVVWSLLAAAAPDADTRNRIYVYGDDVIVPKEFSSSAMAALETFGLRINRQKSCCSGFFRESCGMDAFKGIDVTPVRFRTVWQKSPRPDTYTSYISYANAFYDRGWMSTYRVICEMIALVFGAVPGEDMNISCPSLRYSHSIDSDFKTRWNSRLQKRQYLVREVKSKSHHEGNVCGWQKLLRFFSESSDPYSLRQSVRLEKDSLFSQREPFSVSKYTSRRTSVLVWRWR